MDTRELRVWANHLREKSLTVIDRAVPFDSAGRSAPLTQEEFDRLTAIPCFASDGPKPSSSDFLPPAFTLSQWLVTLGISPTVVEALSESLQETLAFDLRAIGGPFKVSHEQFGALMEARKPVPALVSQLPTPEEQSECPEPTIEEVAAGGSDLPTGGFQSPDAAEILGLEEQDMGNEQDMLTQFKELGPDARAEFVLDGTFTREQLDTLWNLEGQTKRLRSKGVLDAITTALHRLPNKTADSINDALVKESAKG